MLAYIRRVDASRRDSRDAGVSTVEYGLLVAAITAVVILALFAIATLVQKGFDDNCDQLGSKGATSASCPS